MVSQAAPFTSSPATALNSLPRATLALANVAYEKKGSIAYVTVNRPKVLNALNTPTWTDLKAAFEDAKSDASVHGVILTGAGKSFCAGMDLSLLQAIAVSQPPPSAKPLMAAITGLPRFSMKSSTPCPNRLDSSAP